MFTEPPSRVSLSPIGRCRRDHLRTLADVHADEGEHSMTLQLSRWGRRPLLSLLGLAAGTCLPLAPGAAQDAPVVPATPPTLQAAPGAPGDLAPASPGASLSAISTDAIAASGANVYVLRGR